MINKKQISRLLPYMSDVATQKINELAGALSTGANIDNQLRDIVLYHIEYRDHFSTQSDKDPEPVFNELLSLIEKDILR